MARIAGINIPQNKVISILHIYMTSIALSKIICDKLSIPKKTNELSEEEVLKIREFIDQTIK